MKKSRKNKKYYKTIRVFIIVILISLLGILVISLKNYSDNLHAPNNPISIVSDDFDVKLSKYAQKNNLDLSQWPQEYIDKVSKNNELEEFVLNYPNKKDKKFNTDLSELKNSDSVPLLMQWDERWGYEQYAGDLLGFTGCGPTCLSMVSIYLLNDTKYTPKYIAEFSSKNGYASAGNGSLWTLISEGGEKLGLKVTEIPLDKKRIMKNLEAGNPVICVVGPGDFTSNGHFIVLTGCENGMIKVNDPNSKARSEKLWDYEKIKDQIKNLWVCQSK